VPFFNLTLGVLESKFFGESSKILAAAFSLARKHQPCILFFDEIDGMMKKRSSDDQSCTYSFKTEFLAQLDGMTTRATDSVIVIGATNNSQLLDDALKRRLPTVFHVGLPAAPDRFHILSIAMRDEPSHHPRPTASTHGWLVALTDGMSGSDLQEAYRVAAAARLAVQLQTTKFRDMLAAGTDDAFRTLAPITDEHWKMAAARIAATKAAADVAHCTSDGEARVGKVLSALMKTSAKP